MTLRRAHPVYLFFGFAFTVNVVLALLLRLNHSTAVIAGACCDLLFTVPLAYYLLVIRRGTQPLYTIAPVILAGMLRVSYIMPATSSIKIAIGVACEAGLVAFAFTIGRHTRAGRIIAGEIGILRTALFSWRDRPEVPAGARAFTVHQESGLVPMLGLLAFVSVLEAAGVHLIVRRHSATLAWILTAISLYGAIVVIGIARSFALRPVLVTDHALELRNGLIWSIAVPRECIASIAPASQPFPDKRARGYLRITGGGDPRWIVTLREPLIAEGLFGIRKQVRTIGLSVDQPAEFQRSLGL